MTVSVLPNGWSGDIDPVRLNMLAVELSRLVDGTSGGWYSPYISTIGIVGSGLQCSNIGDSTLEGSLRLNGSDAHWQWRLDTTSLGDHASQICTNHDEYHSTVWTGPHTVKLAITQDGAGGDVDVLAGERIRIRHGILGGNHVMEVTDENDVLLAELTPGAGIECVWVEFVFDGTDWFCSAWGAEGAAIVSIYQ